MKKRISMFTAAVLAAAMILGSAAGAAETEAPEETETEAETELVLEEPGIMYLTDTVRVRKGPTTTSETIAFCDRGGSVSVIGIFGDWYHVRLDDPAARAEETEAAEKTEEAAQETEEAAQEGYIYGEYLTDSPEEAQAAVDANNAEIARKQAEAAAAAAAAAAGGSGGKTVVSRRKIEDCDGGGGTIITIYSDGSKSTRRY